MPVHSYFAAGDKIVGIGPNRPNNSPLDIHLISPQVGLGRRSRIIPRIGPLSLKCLDGIAGAGHDRKSVEWRAEEEPYNPALHGRHMGGCPGQHRRENASSEGRLPLDHQSIIRVRLLIEQHHAPRGAAWTRRDHGETARPQDRARHERTL
jgi:hypothetical protein